MIELFISAAAVFAKEKNSQYAILVNRKGIVQNNLSLFNDLYKQLLEILSTGKILYGKDPAKLQEYTFSQLKKQVRQTSKPVSKKKSGGNKKDDEAK